MLCNRKWKLFISKNNGKSMIVFQNQPKSMKSKLRSPTSTPHYRNHETLFSTPSPNHQNHQNQFLVVIQQSRLNQKKIKVPL